MKSAVQVCSAERTSLWHHVRIFLLILLLPCFMRSAAADSPHTAEEIVVVLQHGRTIDEINQRWGTSTLDSYPEADLYLIRVPTDTPEHDFAELIEDDPAVMEAEPNYYQENPEGIREMVLSATGGTYTDYVDQDAANRVGVDEAHELSRGEGIVVAVLDTGIDMNHPVLAANIHPAAYDFIEGDSDPQETANGLDDDQDQQIDEGYGHGTMVAGIIRLVAPEVTILPLRVLDDEGNGEAFTVAKAIRYAEIHGAQILNMSLGSPVEIGSIELQFDLMESGLTIVSGAGNENRNDPVYYPGAFDEVIMATALDSIDVKAAFADFYNDVFVAAPGDGIRSAYPGGGWAIGSGCSFAVPFISGEAALVRSLAPGIAADRLERIIEEAVDNIYTIPENEPFAGKLGSGRVFLPEAVAAAQSIASLDWDVMQAPESYGRLRAFPNPFSAGEVIVELPFASAGFSARAEIFDVAGRIVRLLDPADRSFRWDGRDSRGVVAPSGLYIVRVEKDGRQFTGRILRVR
jgi:subtilisin family serine protease